MQRHHLIEFKANVATHTCLVLAKIGKRDEDPPRNINASFGAGYPNLNEGALKTRLNDFLIAAPGVVALARLKTLLKI